MLLVKMLLVFRMFSNNVSDILFLFCLELFICKTAQNVEKNNLHN